MDPVTSQQKQMSMNPKEGIGKLSLDPVLKIVALEGFIDLSRLRARIIVAPVLAGNTPEPENIDSYAGSGAGVAVLLIGFEAAAFFLSAAVFFLGASIFFPSSMVRTMVLVLTIFFPFPPLMKSAASAMHFYIEFVLLSLAGDCFLETFFAILPIIINCLNYRFK